MTVLPARSSRTQDVPQSSLGATSVLWALAVPVSGALVAVPGGGGGWEHPRLNARISRLDTRDAWSAIRETIVSSSQDGFEVRFGTLMLPRAATVEKVLSVEAPQHARLTQ